MAQARQNTRGFAMSEKKLVYYGLIINIFKIYEEFLLC